MVSISLQLTDQQIYFLACFFYGQSLNPALEDDERENSQYNFERLFCLLDDELKGMFSEEKKIIDLELLKLEAGIKSELTEDLFKFIDKVQKMIDDK